MEKNILFLLAGGFRNLKANAPILRWKKYINKAVATNNQIKTKIVYHCFQINLNRINLLN